MRMALLSVLFALSGSAGAQSGVLVSPLPEVDNARALEVARQVLADHGWTLVPEDRATVEARKDNSAIQVFVSDRALRFSDRSVRPRGTKQRNHREDGPQLSAIPEAEIEALRVDLVAVFEGRQPLAGGEVLSRKPGQVLLRAPAGANPQEVMDAAREVFAGRKWAVSSDADGALVARIRNLEVDSTLKVFLVDDELRFIDGTVDRKGGKAQVPERWLSYLRRDLRQPLSLLTPRAAPKPAPPRAAAPAAPIAGDPAERLRQLKTLLERGLITQAEYDAKRAEILKGL